MQQYFEEYFKYFINFQDKKTSSFYHLPCIFMDNSDFIPANNERIVSKFWHEFLLQNFKTIKLDIKNYEITSVNKASPSLIRVKISFDVFDLNLAKSKYCQILLTLMCRNAVYRIVTTELLNLHVPNIEGITYNKNYELNTKFLKYIKQAA